MRRWLLVAVAVLLVVACGERGGGAGPSLTITSPEDHSQVTVPFTLEVSTDARLGEEGRHLQVFLDGLEGPASTEETVEIVDLAPGDHKIHVSVIAPNGERALADATLHVTVTGP